MHEVLPTGVLGAWTVTSFFESLTTELANDTESDVLQMFFYAVTGAGWAAIREPVVRWKRGKRKRTIAAYIGTDHALTDPNALESMQRHGVDVRMMSSYSGVFHPKVVWLKGDRHQIVWVGSNNLTKDGLFNNIEFAVLIRSCSIPSELARWTDGVASGSTPLSNELLLSYRREREKFEGLRGAAGVETFTWSRKHEPESDIDPPRRGELIIEVMPLETRGGTQVQLPRQAAREFLGLERVGQQKSITLQPEKSKDSRDLVVTVFGNNTVRLSINELDFRDRPCVIVFRKSVDDHITFEIVPKSIFPTRYRKLLALCTQRTRKGSRRWVIV